MTNTSALKENDQGQEFLRITPDNRIMIRRDGELIDIGIRYHGPLPTGQDGVMTILRFLCDHWPLWRHTDSPELPDGCPVMAGATLYAFDKNDGHWEFDLPPLPLSQG